jgi:hypothetical protein
MNDLENYTIAASDGDIGKVKDFLFDDVDWAIRYLVVETGTWLSSRKVLISPIAIQKPNWVQKTLAVLMSKEQVSNSPDIDTDKPVSRQHEWGHLNYYGYSYYWGGIGIWGNEMYPYSLLPGNKTSISDQEVERGVTPSNESYKREGDKEYDPNLRSCKAVVGYQIHAKDGDIGHISGLLVEESTWAVRYFIVDTSNWFGGHKVLISPEWINEIQWNDRSVAVNLTRQLIKDAPKFHSSDELNREHEKAVCQHYGLNGYWLRTKKSNIKSRNFS